MPYPNEFASGESLPSLTQSRSVLEFEGIIHKKDANERHTLPDQVQPNRTIDEITRVVAIDGSIAPGSISNGYPGAEAALMRIAAVVLDLKAIRNPDPKWVPRPSEIRELENCDAVDAVLPGCNVSEAGIINDSPSRFFRRTIFRALQGAVEKGHESLLDTLTAITEPRGPKEIACPLDGCDRTVTPPYLGETTCPCFRKETIYQTDGLRIHERFNDSGPNGQVYTLAQQVTEHLTLVNILRYCEQADHPDFLDETGFIMDGPLAVFGSAAWLHTWIQREVQRIHSQYRHKGHPGILLLGLEKTGHFLEHLKQLDWSDVDGPGQVLPNYLALAPTMEYINRFIVHRPPGSKDFGRQTYYGRKILYKNRNGQHAVVTTPIVNEAGANTACVLLKAFPRLGEVLNILDELSTYLYEDGFAPLVRAHAHAAIPLKSGGEILRKLFAQS